MSFCRRDNGAAETMLIQDRAAGLERGSQGQTAAILMFTNETGSYLVTKHVGGKWKSVLKESAERFQ